MYSATRPRDEEAIKERLNKESPEYAGYSVRKPIEGDELEKFYRGIRPESARGRRVTAIKSKCYSLKPGRGDNVVVEQQYLTAEQIARSRDIVPYELSSSDLRLLRSKAYQKGDRFTVDQRVHLLSKLREYAFAISTTRDSEFHVYKLVTGLYVDSLGRQYEYNGAQYIFKPRNLNFGRGSFAITRNGQTISLAMYAWNALAGLTVEAKSKLLASQGVDFHHVDENLWDVRPSRVLPIPTFIHRWVHSNPLSYQEYVNFFS